MRQTIIILLLALGASLQASTIDLSGSWGLELDASDRGIQERWWTRPFDDSIHLPSTLAEAGKGEPLKMQPVLPRATFENFNPKRGLTFGRSKNYAAENASLLHLYPRFSYVGPAWYRRTINIPKSWQNQDVELELERAIWKTEVWINGQNLGARDSLVTPHRYELGPSLHAGRNEIVIRVDNRRQAAIGNPHAYTEETQTLWNGLMGKIQLTAREKVRLDDLQVRPDLESNGVNVTFIARNGTEGPLTVDLTLQAGPKNFPGRKLPILQSALALNPGDQEQKIFYPLTGPCEKWSEFNPKLYTIKATLQGNGVHSETDASFGMRQFTVDGRRFAINGQPVFLRGTVESCVFPKNGCPDLTAAQWKKIFRTARACGLNHLRFHTWCPPEIAFELADQYGFYLEAELPDWSFHIGQDPAATKFFREEGERMIRAYGNHPSWVMFTMGNELKGDYKVLDDLETHFRALDPQLLYASTTYPSSPRGKMPEPADDYYISQETSGGRVRGQDILNDSRPNTSANYTTAASHIPVPLVSHEVGQYCVFPNVAELPKYHHVLRSTALEAIRDDLQQKGRLDEVPIYVRDSGMLATLLYKEEIERALRTTNQAGFQLLAMNDFPGQGTSTVGPFDAFWDRKGFVTPAEFHRFCGPVVPLALLSKRVFQNDEVFDAEVKISNFGGKPLENIPVLWRIQDGKKTIAGGRLHERHIHYPLNALTRATKLKLTVEIPAKDVANDWDFWVYPATESMSNTNTVVTFHSIDDSFLQALRDGKRVLLLPTQSAVKNPLPAQFTPVFWNPVMFPNQPDTMGAMIDSHHPVFADFPTDPWSNWQWWELMSHSFAVNLDAIHTVPAAPVRFIDKFNRNALPAAMFEARVGPGRLLVCTLDISQDLASRPAAGQLQRSIVKYMSSVHFQPRAALTSADLSALFFVK